MDAFQSALDGLQRESKEQITQVQESASAAVLEAHVVPHRIAVALAQRFTSDRVEYCFPVLCLLDATLVRTSSAAGAASEADQALAAVLGHFWPLAPAAFVVLHDYGQGQPAWREKCLRLVRRWKQRRLLPENLIDALLTAIEHGDSGIVAEAGEEPTRSQGTAPQLSSSPASTAHQGEGLLPNPVSSTALPMSTFTAAQAASFRSTLQACMSALESLPPSRVALYKDLTRAQHFRAPSRTSLAFFEDLLKELRREVMMASSSSSATKAGAGSAAQDGSDPASSGHAREALGKLFDQLRDGIAEGPAGSSAGRRGAASAASTSGSGSPAAATPAVRYVSPIFSDVYAKQPLGQRGVGFGALQRKAEHGGGTSAGSGSASSYSSYYPKPEANAQRPFRIPPTWQMRGGAVRLLFPRPQEWLTAVDTADLVQYAGRDVARKDRKRIREGD